ncbi:peptide deformylase [Candidatus Falkowbacteria bacterium]|jgi:peptide deformylase|nr:peptide deformylase [Candidatus Falkowbacteria bacterium]MBT4433071.1 peptide deformylase [Candidatus Falkowbacteria bacterium]
MLLNIVKYPNLDLNKKSQEVQAVNDEIKQFVLNMIETMKKEDGVGLAAPQVGVSKRIVVVNWHGDDLVLINPMIIQKSWRKDIKTEGCLSLPKAEFKIKRHKDITVKSLDYSGKNVKIKASNLLARIIQHEIDHLNGVLLVDKINNKEKKKYEESL